MMRTGFAIIFSLFVICFIAIVIEEVFLGGKRRRQAERQAAARRQEAPLSDSTRGQSRP